MSSSAASISLPVAATSQGAAQVQPTQGPVLVFEPEEEDRDRYCLDREALDDFICNTPGSTIQFEDVGMARRLGLVKHDDVALFCKWIPNGTRGLGNMVVTVVSKTTLPAAPPLPALAPPPPPLALGAPPRRPPSSPLAPASPLPPQ